MAQPDILIYSHDWHLTRSGAFVDLVVEPLQQHANVVHEAWSNDAPPAQAAAPVLIFCQVRPPIDWMLKQSAKLVWVPMWDDVWHRSQAWWEELPKTLRVVAFSKVVAKRVRAVGLSCLEVQYFKNPADFSPARWEGERVLLYWNRRGIVSPRFLQKFCTALSIDRLLFRPQTDPAVDERSAYDLPERLGRTIVETLATTQTREEYWQLTQRANIVIAPRLFEGAGMVFLEALARGCAVFGNDAPTMNEYITHKQDGYLFRRGWTPQRVRAMLQRRLKVGRPPFVYGLPENQDWNEIGALDLQGMGQQALQKQRVGYANWQKSIPDFVRFMLE